MKNIFLLAVSILSTNAFAKELSVSCNSDEGKSLSLVAEVANATTAPKLKSLEVNDETVRGRDVSKMPVYVDGKFTINVQFGKMFYSSASIEVENCKDSFEAKGQATLKEYVGGFAGTSNTNLTCSCELK